LTQRKYRRHKLIPFNKPVDEKLYSQVRRADNPIVKAAELKILDHEKIRALIKQMNQLATAGLCLSYVVILAKALIFRLF
jgi:hypothetical protein